MVSSGYGRAPASRLAREGNVHYVTVRSHTYNLHLACPAGRASRVTRDCAAYLYAFSGPVRLRSNNKCRFVYKITSVCRSANGVLFRSFAYLGLKVAVHWERLRVGAIIAEFNMGGNGVAR